MIKNSPCVVLKNNRIARGMHKLLLKAPDIAANARPGQFVHITVPNDRSMLLRRPISIYNANKTENTIELVYQVSGKGTQAFSRLGKDKVLDVLGPLGRGFEMHDYKTAFLIGGGCGTAPLRFIPEAWPKVEYHTFLGYGSIDQAYDLHIYDDASKRFFLSTVDGSLGIKGFVTDLVEKALNEIRPDIIMACGPIGMLRQVKKLSFEYKIPCQISLEERMGCGVGGCLVCSCRVKTDENDWNYKRVCKDGPVFWSEEVLLDE